MRFNVLKKFIHIKINILKRIKIKIINKHYLLLKLFCVSLNVYRFFSDFKVNILIRIKMCKNEKYLYITYILNIVNEKTKNAKGIFINKCYTHHFKILNSLIFCNTYFCGVKESVFLSILIL